MICYQDTTFCAMSAKCETMDCSRRLTERDGEQADAMGLPVAWGDLSKTCGKYREMKE